MTRIILTSLKPQAARARAALQGATGKRRRPFAARGGKTPGTK
ncbi:MAG: hypothetical protein AB7T63_09015 [Planctomycetota bacterium]